MNREQKELYRLPNQGKIAGVCAGIAERFGIETWLVRIIFISGVLLGLGAFFIVMYIAGWFILDPLPGSEKPGRSEKRRRADSGYAGRSNKTDSIDDPIEVKKSVWQSGELPKQAVHDMVSRYRGLEHRLQNLETYVTSTEYTVSREINRL